MLNLDVIKDLLSLQDSQNMYNLAVEKLRLGDYPAAKNFMNLVFYVDDKMPSQYYKTFGAICQGLEEYDKAAASYQAALVLEYPKVKDCLFYIGACLFKIGDYAQSKLHLEKFLAEDPANKKLLPRAKLYLKLIEKR